MMTGRARFAAALGAIALTLTAPAIATAEPRSIVAGTVAGFHGKYGLVVRDVRGALAEVTLRQGTIIKPTGLRLERGMKVIIIGEASAETFAAAWIDAPLEVWPPPARAALARALDGPNASNGSNGFNGFSLSSTRDAPDSRWTELAGQYGAPSRPEPRNPH
jgi:hypothetical protein